MSITFNSVKCPECNANLPIEEGRTKIFCSYCGTPVIISNENEYVYRYVDEAKITQSETEKILRLKNMELSEKRHEEREREKALKIKISLILAAIGIIFLIIGFIGGEVNDSLTSFALIGYFPLIAVAFIWITGNDKKDDDEAEIRDSGNIRVPRTIDDFESKNYEAIEAILISAGFTNIKSIALKDLTVGIFDKPNTVESITINGKEIEEGGGKYPSNARIIISYHSFS